MANRPPQLDTSIRIITPENIAFEYRVAGPFRRLPAYLIDLAVKLAASLAGSLVFGVIFGFAGLGTVGAGLGLVWWFLLSWFYGGFFESYFNGRTPGKMAMSIRVLSIDGQPIGGLQAVLRNVLRAIDCQPFIFYLVGLVAASCNDRFQRLGDLACGTMVVIEERPWLHGVARTGEPEAIRIAGLIPANYQASRTLARALAAYVQRRRYFSFGRRMEIARPLAEPLRKQFNLPVNTNLDILLCGLYERTFITDNRNESAIKTGSPFAWANNVPPLVAGRAGSPFAGPPPVINKEAAVAAAMAEYDAAQRPQAGTNEIGINENGT
jgi:uncharacterized RDD family membrane protein YckC